VRKRGRFARCAHGNDSGNAGRDLRFDQFFESGTVNCAIAKGRYQSCEGTAKHFFKEE
jgi:hypothetical protein